MKRYVINILFICLVVVITVSCGNSEINTPSVKAIVETTAAITEPNAYTSVKMLPDADYGGYTFRIWGANFISVAASAQQVPVSELSGDTVNDSLLQRDMIVEQRYNINIEYQLIEKTDDMLSKVKKAVLSGDDEVDMFYGDLISALPPLMQLGALVDFNNIPNIDLNNDWWSQYAREGMTIAGRYYFPMGDITPRLYSSPYLVLFNKNLIADYALELPYGLVKEGKWTLDKMASMGKDVTTDLNGDGMLDMTDRFGHVYEDWSSLSYYVGCGQRMTTTDDGEIKIIMAEPKAIDVINKINAYLTDLSQSMNAQTIGVEKFNAMFQESRALFFNTVISTVPNFRNMDVDFGILPPPKHATEQENYYAYAQPWAAGAAGVPCTVVNLERCGMVIEALGAAAKYTSTPAYFELTLKTKVSRDSESSEMLDIIFDNIYCDLGFSFNWAQTASILRECMIKDTVNMASKYESISIKAEEEISKMLATVKSLK